MEAKDIRTLAINANMETWEFLQKQNLTEDDKDRMIGAAYASHYLWEKCGIGSTVNLARGHWLISRVMCVSGQRDLANRHATLCTTYTLEASDREDFDEVYAVEAEARVAAMSNHQEKARELRAKALAMAETITDAKSRELVINDIMTEPWFGIPSTLTSDNTVTSS